MRRRWSVELVSHGRNHGAITRTWTQWGARRRATRETEADRHWRQLEDAQWIVVRL